MAALALALALAAAPFAAGRADDVEVMAAPRLPRVALELGPTGIVVVAIDHKLYAFVDGADDNAPVKGALVKIGAPRLNLDLKEVSPGIYASGLFVPAAVRTPLTITITTDGQTRTGHGDLILAEPPELPGTGGNRMALWLALAALAAAALVVVWRRQHGYGWWGGPDVAGKGSI